MSKSETTDEPAPMPRRLSEATAAFLLEFPRGYDLPPLEIIVQQINAALRAADAADAQGRSEATSDEARGTPFDEPIEAESRVTGIPQATTKYRTCPRCLSIMLVTQDCTCDAEGVGNVR